MLRQVSSVDGLLATRVGCEVGAERRSLLPPFQKFLAQRRERVGVTVFVSGTWTGAVFGRSRIKCFGGATRSTAETVGCPQGRTNFIMFNR